MGLRLSEKYGVNPSLMCCIICGEATGVALLGHNGGKEAPRKMTSPGEVCDDCRTKHLANGTLLMSVRNRTLTGDIIVVKDEAFQRIFESPVPEEKMAYVDKTLFDSLIRAHEETKAEGKNG